MEPLLVLLLCAGVGSGVAERPPAETTLTQKLARLCQLIETEGPPCARDSQEALDAALDKRAPALLPGWDGKHAAASELRPYRTGLQARAFNSWGGKRAGWLPRDEEDDDDEDGDNSVLGGSETKRGLSQSSRGGQRGSLQMYRLWGGKWVPAFFGGKRAPAFNSWGGRRRKRGDKPAALNTWGLRGNSAFNSWGGKRDPVAFNSWGGKRNPAFNSWGGKRNPAFNSWGGKRSTAFNSWGGKRDPAFHTWGGKRAAAFNSWGGKRAAAFNSWGGKRDPAFHTWGGKRDPAYSIWGCQESDTDNGCSDSDFKPWDDKQEIINSSAFGTSGGKRAAAFHTWGGKRDSAYTAGENKSDTFNSWRAKRAAAFHTWGGKKRGEPTQGDFTNKHEGHALRVPKRAPPLSLWSGKGRQSFWTDKRVLFSPWGGKRSNRIRRDAKDRRVPKFHAWGGKRNNA